MNSDTSVSAKTAANGVPPRPHSPEPCPPRSPSSMQPAWRRGMTGHHQAQQGEPGLSTASLISRVGEGLASVLHHKPHDKPHLAAPPPPAADPHASAPAAPEGHEGGRGGGAGVGGSPGCAECGGAPLQLPGSFGRTSYGARAGQEQPHSYVQHAASHASLARVARLLDGDPVQRLSSALRDFPREFIELVSRAEATSKKVGCPVLQPHQLKDVLDEVVQASPQRSALEGSGAVQLLHTKLQEVLVGPEPHHIALALRIRLQEWVYVVLGHNGRLSVSRVSVRSYLRIKERLSGVKEASSPWAQLEFDMGPFTAEYPRMSNNSSIGHGVEFLNRHLSSYFFCPPGSTACAAPGREMLVSWLRQQHHTTLVEGVGLETRHLVDPNLIQSAAHLQDALQRVDAFLEAFEDSVPYTQVCEGLASLGLMRGWGCDVGRIRSLVGLGLEIMQAPSAETLQAFLSRLPIMQSVVILSPHGFFAQHGVLGRPDTGGQVVYILDQVRALEAEMGKRMADAGLPHDAVRILVVTRLIPEAAGSSCDQRWEAIDSCQRAAILRVPFKDSEGKVLRRWVSRFEVYPFLERFALDVEHELLLELRGRAPDLLIGNYTDGNLVASLLSQRLGVTQCNIAHALEMTKYPDASRNWQAMDPAYHFSCQFTADLLSMNHADFIITSTYQEIAGKANQHSLGQYEAFRSFTMPGLIRVLDGMDVFDPRFNIVSPGADESVYFPATDTHRRLTHMQSEVEELLYGQTESSEVAVGVIAPERRQLPLLFAMARLDRVKNLTGLAEMYASNTQLQQLVNLAIVGGVLDPAKTKDTEEKAECSKLQGLLAAPGLLGKCRWITAQTNRVRNGEMYRMVADTRGAFVQPALFEAFGLTVVEAMSCGLPTFATCFGGPSEIIKHGSSGFQIDPHQVAASAQLMADFFQRCKDDCAYWDSIRDGALERIQSRYTWRIYASRLMDLARVYTFWRHVTDLERREVKALLQTLYTLLYRPLMHKVPEQRDDEMKGKSGAEGEASAKEEKKDGKRG